MELKSAFSSPGRLNDLHNFDPTTSTWTELSTATAGIPPSARAGHGVAAAGGKLYVLGGSQDGGEQRFCLPKLFLTLADLNPSFPWFVCSDMLPLMSSMNLQVNL